MRFLKKREMKGFGQLTRKERKCLEMLKKLDAIAEQSRPDRVKDNPKSKKENR